MNMVSVPRVRRSLELESSPTLLMLRDTLDVLLREGAPDMARVRFDEDGPSIRVSASWTER